MYCRLVGFLATLISVNIVVEILIANFTDESKVYYGRQRVPINKIRLLL